MSSTTTAFIEFEDEELGDELGDLEETREYGVGFAIRNTLLGMIEPATRELLAVSCQYLPFLAI